MEQKTVIKVTLDPGVGFNTRATGTEAEIMDALIRLVCSLKQHIDPEKIMLAVAIGLSDAMSPDAGFGIVTGVGDLSAEEVD